MDKLHCSLPGLSKAEELLLAAALKGGEVDIDCSPRVKNQDLNTRVAGQWNFDQSIRPALVNCVWSHSGSHIPLRSISIRGAHFINSEKGVDLSNFEDLRFVTFQLCRFEEELDVSESRFYTLSLEGCWVKSFFAKGIEVEKELTLCGLGSPGRISLERAKIGGDIDLSRYDYDQSPPTKFLGSVLGEERQTSTDNQHTDRILNCENVHVAGSVYLDGCTCFGSIDLTGAEIGGDLDFAKSILNGLGRPRPSLRLEKSVVGGGIFIADGFESSEQISIDNSTVKNGLSIDGASFSRSNPDQAALSIETSKISGDTHIGNENAHCTADGVSLKNSEFGALSLFATVRTPGLNLRNTKVVEYIDRSCDWKDRKDKFLYLDGFTYTRIRDHKYQERIQVKNRVHWLKLDSSNSPQPYVQLAAVLREQGDDAGAVAILEKMESELGKDSLLAPIGYGYAPLWALGYLLGLTVIGWIVYRRNFLSGKITPTEKEPYSCFKVDGNIPPHYPRFSALMYSLENTFPLVDLGQAAKWQPDPSLDHNALGHQKLTANIETQGTTSSAPRKLLERVGHFLTRSKRVSGLRIFLWVQILVGWLLAALFVAGISGLIRR